MASGKVVYGSWTAYVQTLAEAYAALPAQDRQRAVIYTSTTARPARFGPQYDLPEVYGGHNELWFAGPPPESSTVVVAWTQNLPGLSALFATCTQHAGMDNQVGVDDEEQVAVVAVCRDPIGGWAARHRGGDSAPVRRDTVQVTLAPPPADLGQPAPVKSGSRRRRIVLITVPILTAVVAVALYWFQPWKLFTNTTVNEVLPSAAPATGPGGPDGEAPPGQNVLLATGTLVSHEHTTTGSVRLIQLAEGGYQVTLENLDTSDGPDLHVWITDAPVIEGRDGWHVFDDGRYVDLGPLRGNIGNQVYDVPAGTDLNGLTSVSIWCARFRVSFGAAELIPA